MVAKPRRRPSAGLGSHPATPVPSSPCSGTTPTSDALFGCIKVSTLLSLLHRLLSEHELKLTLCLLESLADSKISVSMLSVPAVELQKTLLSFCGARRKLSSHQCATGIQLIEDICMSSCFGRAAADQSSESRTNRYKRLHRSKTLGTGEMGAARSSQLSCQSSGTTIHKHTGTVTGPPKMTLLSAPKTSHSTPNSAIHTPSCSLPATPRGSAIATPRGSIGLYGQHHSSHPPLPPLSAHHGSPHHRGTPLTNGSSNCDQTLSAVVPGVPEHTWCDQRDVRHSFCEQGSIRRLHQQQHEVNEAFGERRTDPIGQSERPLLPAWRWRAFADAPKYDSTGRCGSGSMSNDSSTGFRDELSQAPVMSLHMDSTGTEGLHSKPEDCPECPLGGHAMVWCSTGAEYLCHACAAGHTGPHWHCDEHLLDCCPECINNERTSQVAELHGTYPDVGGLEELEAHVRIRCSLNSDQSSIMGAPAAQDDDVSSDGSDKDLERPEVSWNDELDDLSAVQVAWLATPTDKLMQHPNGTKRVFWDVLALLFIVMDCITLPLKLCFSINTPVWTSWITAVFFMLDMVLNFNTGYFHGSILILRRPMVVRHYLRTWFVLDFIATMPWEEVITAFAGGEGESSGGEHTLLRLAKLSRYMRCVRLLRVMKVQKLMDRFQEMQWFNAHSRRFALSIIQMLSIFGMLCHWAACIFGLIGEPTTFSAEARDPHNYSVVCVPGGPCEAGIMGTPWRHRYGLDNYDLGTQYLIALHFATGLVTGGELALQPGFWMERLYVVIMMITGLFVCSAVLSQVLVLITKKAEENIELNEQVWAVKKFMMLRKVPPELQGKVRRYLEQQTKMKEEGNDYDAMDYLSPALRIELIEHLNRKVITKHPFFAKMSEEAVQSICIQAVPTMFSPGDVVVEKGQLALSMDFVVRGKLKVEGMQKIVYLSSGSWLGDRCLFVDTQRSHTVTAVTSSEVLCVQKRSVVAVCSEYHHMQEHYDQFQKRICDGENLLLCTICKQPGHTEEDCPEHPDRVHARRSTAKRRSGGEDSIATAAADDVKDGSMLGTFVRQATRKLFGEEEEADERS